MTLKSFAPFLILLLNVITSQTHSCDPYGYQTPDGCCPKCKPGLRVNKNCTESMTSSCDPCTNGTFMDDWNPRPECYNCTKCDEAAGLKTNTSCTTVSDTVCEPVEGFYCSEPKKNDCVKATKHTRCKPGEYISKNGTSSTDTECSTCSNGTFSDGTFTSCQNHTQCESKGLRLWRAGTKTEDAQCGELPRLIICGGFIEPIEPIEPIGLIVPIVLIGLELVFVIRLAIRLVIGLVIGLVFCLGWKFLKNRQQNRRPSVLYTPIEHL